MDKLTLPPLWYFAPAHREFPTTKAYSVQIMKACSGFAMAGAQTTLVLPFRPDTAGRLKAAGRSLWDLYAVPENFKLRWCLFPYPWYWAQQGLYSIFAAGMAHREHVSLAFTRNEWVALPLWASGIPTMLELHDFIPNPALRWTMQRARTGRFLGIVCVSQALTEAAVNYGFPRSLILTEHGAVDLERFMPPLDMAEAKRKIGLSPNTPVACYAGNLHVDPPAMDTLLACAELLPDVTFLLVGGRPNSVTHYRELAAGRGLSNVRVVGFVPNAALPTYLYAADVLLLSYTHHTPWHRYISPMKMFEYLAAGRPIVATDLPTVREVLVEGEQALFVQGGDAAAFAAAIRRILAEPALAQRLSAGARHSATQHTWLLRQRRILEFIHERLLVTQAKPPA